MKGFIAFLVGLIFSFGLGLSGMTQPHIVKGFLDIFGEWDWRLMGVMIGAIGVHAITYFLIRKRSKPILDEEFHVPAVKHMDGRLILGAVIFGLGWGWAGICPGPGIVSLVSGEMAFIYFFLAMLFGMQLFLFLEPRIKKK